MAREIKFRMWIYDKMVYRGIYDKNWYFHPTEKKLWRKIQQNDHTFPLMQSTGLSDKNGKDIYEGDIVKHNFWFTDKRECISIIKFGIYSDDDQYSTHNHLGFYISWNLDNDGHSLSDVHERAEIIGNIYQNPELLK